MARRLKRDVCHNENLITSPGTVDITKFQYYKLNLQFRRSLLREIAFIYSILCPIRCGLTLVLNYGE